MCRDLSDRSLAHGRGMLMRLTTRASNFEDRLDVLETADEKPADYDEQAKEIQEGMREELKKREHPEFGGMAP